MLLLSFFLSLFSMLAFFYYVLCSLLCAYDTEMCIHRVTRSKNFFFSLLLLLLVCAYVCAFKYVSAFTLCSCCVQYFSSLVERVNEFGILSKFMHIWRLLGVVIYDHIGTFCYARIHLESSQFISRHSEQE